MRIILNETARLNFKSERDLLKMIDNISFILDTKTLAKFNYEELYPLLSLFCRKNILNECKIAINKASNATKLVPEWEWNKVKRKEIIQSIVLKKYKLMKKQLTNEFESFLNECSKTKIKKVNVECKALIAAIYNL